MSTIIEYNGSKWAGEGPDSLDLLYKRLAENVLMPSLGPYSGKSLRHEGHHHFFGNFVDVSATFSIHTTDLKLIEKLTKLIRENISTPEWKALRREWVSASIAKARRDR